MCHFFEVGIYDTLHSDNENILCDTKYLASFRIGIQTVEQKKFYINYDFIIIIMQVYLCDYTYTYSCINWIRFFVTWTFGMF